MEILNHYSLSEKLLEVRANFAKGEYSEESTNTYFRETIKHIHHYYCSDKDRKSNYLFCSIGYIDENKTKLIPYKYNDEILNKYHIDLIEELTKKWINKQGSISITEMFLHKETVNEHYKALLYSAESRQFELDEFIYVNLKDLNWKYAGSLSSFESNPFGSYNFSTHFTRKSDNGHKSPFLKITNNNPSDEDKAQFDKLISVFAEVSSDTDGDCFYYFLKPVTFQDLYNVVFLLGVKKELTPDEIELWLDKTRTILSIIADKKLKKQKIDEANVTYLKGMSATTHALKTTLNTVFSAPLNSLKSDLRDDLRVQLISDAKETLLLNAEVVNLLSKLNITTYSEESKIKALKESGLFEAGQTPVNLKALIESRLNIWHMDKSGSLKEISLDFNCNTEINKNFLQFQDVSPTERFYEMIILTVIENCNRHANSNDFMVKLRVEMDEHTITFINKLKPNGVNFNHKELSGNYLILNSILKNLNIGHVTLGSENNNFFIKITAENS